MVAQTSLNKVLTSFRDSTCFFCVDICKVKWRVVQWDCGQQTENQNTLKQNVLHVYDSDTIKM